MLKKQTGYLYEIPLFFFAYFLVCLLFMPVLSRVLPLQGIAILIIMCLGFGIVLFLGRSISEPRFRFLKIPLAIWIYLLSSAIIFPLILSMPEEIIASVILTIQAFASFWLDLRIA